MQQLTLFPKPPCRYYCNVDNSVDRCGNCGHDGAAHGLTPDEVRLAMCPGMCNLDRDRPYYCSNCKGNHPEPAEYRTW